MKIKCNLCKKKGIKFARNPGKLIFKEQDRIKK
jgi:hypothetical protein